MNFFRFRDKYNVVINVDKIEYFVKAPTDEDDKIIGIKVENNKDYVYLHYNCKKSRDKDYNRFVKYLNGGKE